MFHFFGHVLDMVLSSQVIYHHLDISKSVVFITYFMNCLPNPTLESIHFLAPNHSIFHVTIAWSQNHYQNVEECWHLPAFTHRWRRFSAEHTNTCSLSFYPRHVPGKSLEMCTACHLCTEFQDKLCWLSICTTCDGFLCLLLLNGFKWKRALYDSGTFHIPSAVS